MKKDATASFEKDLAGVRDAVEAGTRKMHREIEARLKELGAELELGPQGAGGALRSVAHGGHRVGGQGEAAARGGGACHRGQDLHAVHRGRLLHRQHPRRVRRAEGGSPGLHQRGAHRAAQGAGENGGGHLLLRCESEEDHRYRNGDPAGQMDSSSWKARSGCGSCRQRWRGGSRSTSSSSRRHGRSRRQCRTSSSGRSRRATVSFR